MHEYIYKFTGKNTTGQAFTTEALTTYSFDLRATGKYLGNMAKEMVFKGLVVTAFTGAASGIRVHLTTSAAEAGTSDRTVGVFLSSGCDDDAIIPTTDLDAVGDCIWAKIAPNIPLLQYLVISVVPVSEALATGYFEFTMEDGDGSAGTGCVA
jgi:hypothetical protein